MISTALETNRISAAFPYKKQRRRVLGREMAYVEVGEGDPIVLLHGNPTSSYLWRNVLPHLQPLGRCIAPDLIGMGDSDKLPNSGPGSYRFVEHRRYLDALLEALDVHERVTFVIHDWGSALGFDWANRHREAVKGIAHMEAIVQPQGWDHWDNLNARPILKALRSEDGDCGCYRARDRRLAAFFAGWSGNPQYFQETAGGAIRVRKTPCLSC
jgi:haloalkane dehalogenase